MTSGGHRKPKAPAQAEGEVHVAARTNHGATPPPSRVEIATAVEPVTATSGAALELMLRIEAMARKTADVVELRHLIANETRKLNRARQIFVVEVAADGAVLVACVTGVAIIDTHAPMTQAVVEVVRAIAADRGLQGRTEFALPAYCEAQSDLARAYPFREMAWTPLLDRRGRVFAGLLCAREEIWSRADLAITERLADVYAHAWRELVTASHFRPRRVARARFVIAAVIAGTVLLALPVPMTALAPAEIVAAQPFVVASPIDGVIDQIEIEPGSPVEPGAVLVRFTDTVLRARLEVARREVAIAEARVKQATMLAFSDEKGRHDLGLAETELELKRTELDYAAQLFDKTVLRAERAGLAVYADRKALIGRPVSTGERIMEIADPASVEVRIDLAVPDAIALEEASAVKLFLDIDPLHPRAARVVRSDYKARTGEADVLAFRTIAQLQSDTGAQSPRIGLRGTAQVYGRATPLALFLFRRPLSATRQWLGL